MGGNAFAHAIAEDGPSRPTLRTPRMSPETYRTLKDIYTLRLRNYFIGGQVSILREAPEKVDYGDVDFMVASEEPFDPWHLASALGAAGYLSYGGQHHLAVPVDGTKYTRPPVRYFNLNDNRKPSEKLSETIYAQLDIDLIKPDLFAWHSFYGSYGDLSGLLGQIMNNLGFKVSDKGVALRLQELDDSKTSKHHLRIVDKQGLLFLSKDPDQVMGFLGLHSSRYNAGFNTMNDFYAWLAQCRLLTSDYVGNLQYKRKDTSNQRQKEHKRPIITNFFKEYLPAHLGQEAAEIDDSETWKASLAQRRAQWCAEAVKFFQKSDEYEQMHTALVNTIANQTAECLIKPMVLEHYGGSRDKVHEIVRGIRRWVGFEDGQPKILAESHSDEDSQLRFWLEGDSDSLKDAAAADEWIKNNWAKCKALERESRK